jgi:hypothetical protein
MSRTLSLFWLVFFEKTSGYESIKTRLELPVFFSPRGRAGKIDHDLKYGTGQTRTMIDRFFAL